MRDFRSKVRCSAATVAYGVLAAAFWDALKFFIEQLTEVSSVLGAAKPFLFFFLNRCSLSFAISKAVASTLL